MKQSRRLETGRGLIEKIAPFGSLSNPNIRAGKLLHGHNKDKDYYLPEEVLDALPENIAKFNESETNFTVLEQLSKDPEILDIMSRIVSYIIITPQGSNAFAEINSDLDTAKYAKKLETVNNEFRRLLTIIANSNNKLRINAILIDWLSFGNIYAYLQRDDKGAIESILVTRERWKEQKYMDKVLLTIPADSDKPEDVKYVEDINDIAVLSYFQVNRKTFCYLENVRKHYNLSKIVEQTRVSNAIMAAQFRSIYTVPTNGLPKIKAKQRMSKIYSMWKRQIELNYNTGELTVNGKNSWQINTELWTSSSGGGQPSIQNPGDGNPNLNNMDLVKHFDKKFYKQTKLPISKYEAVDMSYLGDISKIDEDERQFTLFVNDCRTEIGSWLLQMLKQLLQENKEFAGDVEFLESLSIRFYDETNEKQREMELSSTSQRMNNINQLSQSLSNNDPLIAAKIKLNLIEQYLPEFYAIVKDELAEVVKNLEKSANAKTDESDSSGKPAGGSSSKPAGGSSSKPAGGSSGKPSSSTSSEPTSGSSSKPKGPENS